MTVRRPIRRRLMGSHTMTLTRPVPARGPGSGSLQVLGGFSVILLAGTLLLTFPFAAESGEWTHPYDAFFTAVSAICVTGLVVFDTQTHWSFWGELTIIVLIQAGGLGYMMGTSVVLWALGRRLGLRDTYMLRLYYGAPSMAETFKFARRVAFFAVGVEAIGAAALYVAFVLDGLPADRAVWWSIFHALSAFNNAGFNVTGNDLYDYKNSASVLLIISSLVIAGGVGAVPVFALVTRRSFKRLPIDAKLIFVTTGMLLALGTAYLLAVEWDNEATIGGATVAHRPILAFFQAAVPRTAGFSAVDIADMNDESKFFQMALMLIGGAAGSTAGGIKVGTFSLLLFALFAALRGRRDVIAFGRRVSDTVIYQALTIVLLAIAVVFASCLALLSLTGSRDIDVMFESLSALGTVGLTTGVTAAANEAARGVLIIGMLLGRFGPLLLVLEMTRPRQQSTFRLPDDSIRLG